MPQDFKTVGEKILRRTPYGVRVEGTVVVMTIGERNVRMDYETALKLSAFLRHGGRLAKRAAGDESRRFTVYADLTDANADEMKAAMSVDRKQIFFNKKV
jgi:hypothetical protein